MEKENIENSSLRLFVTTFYNSLESAEDAEKIYYELNQLKDNLLELMDEETSTIVEDKLRIAVKFLSERTLGFLAEIDTSDYIEAVNYFNDLHHEDREPINVTLTSAVPLNESQRKRIIKAFRNKVENHHLYVKEIVDESVLGGVKLESDNYSFDNTLQTKMSEMKNYLLQDQ